MGLNVPKNSVSHFVTRVDLLRALQKCLLTSSEATSVVLQGMGGSGKAQLALECCRLAGADFRFTAVMWIDVSSPKACVHSYSNIVQEITGISRSTSSVEHNIRLVEKTLQQQKGKWLAVLDNFDDPKGFHEYNIQHYLPKATGGAVLITSRHTGSERLGHVIKVEKMSDDKSLTLLLQRPSLEKIERQQGLSIAGTLGRLALALDQAGVYIRARRFPLQDFETHYKTRKKVILAEIPDQWEYRKKLGLTEGEIALSVFITWELLFALICGDQEEVDKKDHFLTLAAHFNNQCVS